MCDTAHLAVYHILSTGYSLHSDNQRTRFSHLRLDNYKVNVSFNLVLNVGPYFLSDFQVNWHDMLFYANIIILHYQRQSRF
jgi:hypothetical protein